MAANSLKVDELRSQLAQRGLSTAGNKSTLVQRLEAALRDESVKSTDSSGNHKRRRDSDADDEPPRKVKAVDELRSMNLKQLREEAANRGISASGTKKELLERLCADDDGEVSSDNDGGEDQKEDEEAETLPPQKVKADDELRTMNVKQLREEAAARGISATGTKKELLERLCNSDVNVSTVDDQVKGKTEEKAESSLPPNVKAADELRTMNIKQLREEAAVRGISTSGTKKELLERLCADDEEVKEEKIVTATKKGSAVLDKWLPDEIKAQFHVLQVGDDIYDAMLNQTNVGQNNNKFYVIQVLESDDGGKFMVYNRWRRVGVRRQENLNGPYTSQLRAISEFEKKFYDKTKNLWLNRDNFVSYPGSDTWLEMDYSENKIEQVQVEPESKKKTESGATKLEAHIARFISLICNTSMMHQQMIEIGYNAEKLPLGKLSKSTILKGYDVLKRISDVIGQADRKTLEQLSGRSVYH